MDDYVSAPIEIPATVVADLKKLKPLFDVAVAVHELGTRLHAVLDRPTRTPFQTVAYVAFGKAFRTVQSVINLCLCGCGVDAMALCGSLFENFVDLKYMARAPVRRPLRYIQFEQVEKLYQAEKILAHRRLPRGTRRRYKGYEKILRPQVAQVLQYFPRRAQGWAQLSLKQRAKAVGMELEYEELYWIFCGHKHTLPASAQAFVIEEGMDIDVSVGPNVRGVFNALLHTLRYGLNIFAVINNAYSEQLQPDIDKVAGEVIAASDQVLQTAPEVCS